MTTTQLRGLVEASRSEIIRFAQRLLQTPSLSGQEGEAAQLVADELRSLGVQQVWVEAVGNVLAKLDGAGRGSVILHAHLDVVDPGDLSLWSHGPFSGHLADGFLWGRGAADDKGCVVAQVYALGLLCRAGLVPRADAYLAAVVGEEVGGQGTQHLVTTLHPNLAIIGEPSGNTLRRGHRGRYEFIVSFRGRSAHASAPGRGLNPLYSMARFLLALRDAPMRCDPVYGGTTVVPTLSYVDQSSSNVIPAEASVHLDWRNAPGESVEDARGLLLRLVRAACDQGITAEVTVRERQVRSYTGIEDTVRFALTPFELAANEPLLAHAQRLLEETLGHPVPVEVWTFATDGPFLHAAGVPCLGFGPGEESMAHVRDERVSVEQLLEATAAYMALALELGQ